MHILEITSKQRKIAINHARTSNLHCIKASVSLSPSLHFRPHAMRTFMREDKQRAILVRYVQRYTNLVALALTGQKGMKESGENRREKQELERPPEKSKESQFHLPVLVFLLLVVPCSPRRSRSPLLPRRLRKRHSVCADLIQRYNNRR